MDSAVRLHSVNVAGAADIRAEHASRAEATSPLDLAPVRLAAGTDRRDAAATL
ncbi:hypothetical protein [Pseudoclavibacter sp. JSM 162008]|uniref:hypothetical protein n=1 Tax=Pseudoclavibacter sp. JSM 162008 TaxID=3229855 RepID=UPI003523B5E0